MMYSGVWILAICERSGPTGLAPTSPALWQATQAPLPTNTAWPAFGSPGSSIDAAPPACAVATWRDVVQLHVHRAPEALEEGGQSPRARTGSARSAAVDTSGMMLG